jgi:hypothetical protein
MTVVMFLRLPVAVDVFLELRTRGKCPIFGKVRNAETLSFCFYFFFVKALWRLRYVIVVGRELVRELLA